MSSISQAAVGKWPGILIKLGVERSFLQNKHGPCPICGGKDRFRFDDKGGKGSYFCSGCGAGDGFDLLRKVNGWSFAKAANEIELIIGSCQMEPVKHSDNADNEKRLKNIYSGLKRITHTDTAGKYLLSRGITTLPAQDVYFHHGVDYYTKNEDNKPVKVGKFPAMVSIFRNLQGETCTYHLAYLTPDGKKLDGYPAKKFLPKIREMTGGAVRLAGAGDCLAVAEGIETGLAVMQDTGIPTWAATNAHCLETIRLPEQVKSVIIYTDEDRSFTGQKAAYVLANRLKVQEGKQVNVVRLLGKGLDYYTDCGLDADYCDFINK